MDLNRFPGLTAFPIQVTHDVDDLNTKSFTFPVHDFSYSRALPVQVTHDVDDFNTDETVH